MISGAQVSSGWNWWILTFSGCWWAPASISVHSKICFFFCGFSFQTGLKTLCEFVLTNYNANQFRLKLIDIVHFAWTFVLMMDSEKLWKRLQRRYHCKSHNNPLRLVHTMRQRGGHTIKAKNDKTLHPWLNFSGLVSIFPTLWKFIRKLQMFWKCTGT